jgi:RepB DNA-primase from phage plasmid
VRESYGPKSQLSPSEFVRANFQVSDRIAVLIRNAKRRETVQRISTADRVAATPFQDWMHYKNDKEGSDVYIGMNALKPGAFTRTKEDILAIRHLYMDLDHDGPASLAAMGKSAFVPLPNYILSTSPDKYQVIWKVEDIALVEAEAMLRALAHEFGGDHAATDAARVLRIPGFVNRKYEQAFLVGVRSQTDRVYHLRDFKLRTELIESDDRRPHPAPRKTEPSGGRRISQSERDWAYVKSALTRGADPEELITQLAHSRAADKSDPHYYARLTVKKALADLHESGSLHPEADGDRRSSGRDSGGWNPIDQ